MQHFSRPFCPDERNYITVVLFRVMRTEWIPKGWFWMGSQNHYKWESPRHRVWLDAFAIATTAVTRREYARFLADTGYAPPVGWNHSSFNCPEQPVVGVNWFAALAYCEWLSRLDGQAYRLPTEAEWEKACRGG